MLIHKKDLFSSEATIFSDPNWNKRLIFPVHISFINKHLFFKYSVRWSVGQATKGKNVKTWKCDFLAPYFNFLYFINISYDFKQLRYLWMMSSLFVSKSTSFPVKFEHPILHFLFSYTIFLVFIRENICNKL